MPVRPKQGHPSVRIHSPLARYPNTNSSNNGESTAEQHETLLYQCTIGPVLKNYTLELRTRQVDAGMLVAVTRAATGACMYREQVSSPLRIQYLLKRPYYVYVRAVKHRPFLRELM